MLRRAPGLAQHKSAHGIPLLNHTVLSRCWSDSSLAVGRGDAAGVRWRLENARPDLSWRSLQGKTALGTPRGG